MSLSDYFYDEFAAQVWLTKYKANGEKTPEDMWKRLATTVSKFDTKDEDYYFEILKDFKFVPGGRILAGLGVDKKVTFGNCYVIPIHDDTLESIFQAAKEIAITYSRGGGVGIDITPLRWRGAPVHNSANTSTGAVSFIDLFSFTTNLIGQKGRRGALLVSIEDTHPDIEEFIDIKSVPTDRTKQLFEQAKKLVALDDSEAEVLLRWLVNRQIEFANLSVKLTDDFLEAVESDSSWELSFSNGIVKVSKQVSARKLWNKIIHSAWKSAEPGILFWDKVKKYSNSEYFQPFLTVNPCGERPLPAYGVCLLGSINLSKFSKEPFYTEFNPSEPLSEYIDFESLDDVVYRSVRFLDTLIDADANYPLPQQKEVQQTARRIGLGIMGLADLFIRLGVTYGDDNSLYITEEVMKRIRDAAYLASISLAEEKGSFPGFDKNKYLEQSFATTLPRSIRQRIRKNGIRNVELLSVAPTGSISIIASTSSGIEPVFSLSYERFSATLNQTSKILHPLVREYLEFSGKEFQDLKNDSRWITSHSIDPDRRIEMQAQIQKFVDASISSTVNLPFETSEEEVARIYKLAYQKGLKGVTIYRAGTREDILRTQPVPVKTAKKKFTRPFQMSGSTFRFDYREEKYYVAVSLDEDHFPREVFVVSSEHSEWQQATAFLLSKLLRSSQDRETLKKIIQDLYSFKEVHGRGVVYQGYFLPSRVGILAQALRLVTEEQEDDSESSEVIKIEGDFQRIPDGYKIQTCPSCGSVWLVPESMDLFACDKGCPSCGYSVCS